MTSFAKRLRALRADSGYKQSELADKLRMGAAAISKYETGRSEPEFHDLVALCKIFNVSADYLLGLSDNPAPVKSADISFTDGDIAILTMIEKLPDNAKHEVKGYINGLLASHRAWLA